jgi:deazaflavin-dependent oxidoreductase (nitroreductase family)
VSFSGGGTDLPYFYQKEMGAVLSVGLSQYMYVTVSPRFKASTRIAYTKTEIAESIDQIEHAIAREALRMTDLGKHLEITTIGDVPSGTGLGSSSSLAVGLINALNAYKGQISSPQQLAEKACEIEIDILNKPIGKQDQYAAAFGSLNYIRFNSDESVDVEPVPYRPETLRELESRTLLLYTKGAKTGAQRRCGLPYFKVDGQFVVRGSNGGGPTDPHWCHNVRANSDAMIRVSGRTKIVHAHVAQGEEREVLFTKLSEMSASTEQYQTMCAPRELPLVVLKEV